MLLSERLSEEIADAVERVSASVVRIRREGGARRGSGEPGPVEGAGTGFVYDAGGLIATNDHVVRAARHVTVVSADGRTFAGEVVGEDPATDVAVVRVPTRELPVASLGDSERLRVGQIVLAIGDSLGLPGTPTVSTGVVSALGRPLPGADHILEGILQTDAAINPGNSGGPLVNVRGEVVGMNTAMVPFAQGVGFAVPINTVRRVADQLIGEGRVLRPYLGVSAVALDPALAKRYRLGRSDGVLLVGVSRHGPAAGAGLEPGDVLTRVGSVTIRSLRGLLSGLSQLPIGGAVDITFERSGVERKSVVRVTAEPRELRA
ncbi:MAG: trypsin-like peptidase domain-containing protein [Thermoplasmata archaeon]|nr:trypsin-like peptidase domain-containing protein [Thermoplasmata archaeon]